MKQINYAFYNAFEIIKVRISVIKLTIEKFFADEIFSFNVLKIWLTFFLNITFLQFLPIFAHKIRENNFYIF